jgi:predicted TIM-barrel fold metal-dependent hydrolase
MVKRMIDNNQWACDAGSSFPNLIAFAGINPVFMREYAMVSEIQDKIAKGARGFKLLPSALRIFGDEHRIWLAYEAAARLGVPVLAESGGSAGQNEVRSVDRSTLLRRSLIFRT